MSSRKWRHIDYTENVRQAAEDVGKQMSCLLPWWLLPCLILHLLIMKPLDLQWLGHQGWSICGPLLRQALRWLWLSFLSCALPEYSDRFEIVIYMKDGSKRFGVINFWPIEGGIKNTALWLDRLWAFWLLANYRNVIAVVSNWQYRIPISNGSARSQCFRAIHSDCDSVILVHFKSLSHADLHNFLALQFSV